MAALASSRVLEDRPLPMGIFEDDALLLILSAGSAAKMHRFIDEADCDTGSFVDVRSWEM